MDAKLAVELSRQWRNGAPASTLKAAGVLLHVIDGGMGGIFHDGQLVNALLCALTRQGLKGETNKGKLKISDLTVTFGADVFGAGGGEAKVSYFSNSFGSMDKVSRATTLPRATALPRPRV